VTVNDSEDPTISCVINQTRDADPGVCTYTTQGTEFDPTAFNDNCPGSTVSNNYNGLATLAGAIFPNGTTTVIWTVTDATGNTATCSFTVTVNDSENPTISCVVDQVRNADTGVCTYTTIGTEFDPTAFNDNCPGPTVSNSYNGLSTLAGAIFPKGTITVIWTVTDASNNTATCSFTVTVNDSEDPTISCVADQTRDTDPGVCTYTAVSAEFDPTGFNDNCPGSTVSNNYNGLTTLAGAVFSKGTTTVIWTVTDASGNAGTCSFTLTVIDPELPTITCPADIEQLVDPGYCQAYVNVPVPQIADNCPGSYAVNNYTGTSNASAIYPSGTTIVTWTVFDEAGNSSTCQHSVRIISYPVAMDDFASVLEDMTVTIPVLANDTDCDNNISIQTLTVVQPPSHGSAVVNPGGTIQYSPFLNYYGTDLFTYRICDVDGLCDTATVTINVLPVNDPPITYNENVSLCENTSITGNILANGDADTVEMTVLTVMIPPVSGPSHGTFILQSNGDYLYTPDAHYFGPDMVVVSLCDNGYPMPPECTNDTVFIDVMEAVTALAGNTQELCDATSAVLTGSVPDPGTGNWTQFSGPSTATITPPNSATATASGLVPGVYVFTYTVVTGVCSTWDTVTVVNYHLPTPAVAGPDQDLCLNGMATTSTIMSGNTPVYGTGNWTQVSGPTTAVLADASDPMTAVSNLAYGTYEFTWTISIGVCTPSVDTVRLFVWYLSTANAGPDELVCEMDTLYLANATASNYLSLVWGTTGDGAFNDPTQLNPYYVPGDGDIMNGSVQLYLTTYGHSPCAPVTDTMTLSIQRAPLAMAGPDGMTCQEQAYTVMGAVAGNYTSLLWTHNGQGTLNNPTIISPTYVPALLETGTITLTLTVNGIGPCGQATDEMELEILPYPQGSAGPDGITCENEPFTVYNAWATNANAILWTHNGQGTLINQNTLSPTYFPAPGEVDTVELTMIMFGYAPCWDQADHMNIYIIGAPVANAGPDLASCGTTPVQITASMAFYYTSLRWTTSGTGTFSDTTILNPYYYPSNADVVTGNVLLMLNASGYSTCPESTDTLELSLTPAAIADAGEDEYSCMGNSFTVTDANAYNYSSIKWTHNGTGTLTGVTTLTPTYIPQPTELGEVILTLHVNADAPCDSTFDEKILTINPGAAVNAGPDAIICEDEDLAIEGASGMNFEDVAWTSTGTGNFNNPLILNPVYNPSQFDIATGQVMLILSAIPLSGCPPVTDTLVLTISRKPAVEAGPDLSACPGTQVYLNQATATNWSSATWTANGSPLFKDPDSLSVKYDVPAGSSEDIWMNLIITGTGGCQDRVVSDSLLLTVKEAPIASAGPDRVVAPGVPITLEGEISGGSGAYFINWEPAQLLADPAVEDPVTVPLMESVTFTLSVLDLISGCSVMDQVFIDVSSSQLPPQAITDYDSTLMNVAVMIRPMENDYDPGGGVLNYFVLEGPYHGFISPATDSMFSYTPYPGFVGTDSLRYYVVDNDPIPQFDTAMIYIFVGEEIPVVIHNVITPNGDGLNDKWTIGGIENYPNNTINIFNRWGDKIRTFNAYDNSSVVWDGTNRHGEPVPDGTYFYILEIPNIGDYNGWIFVRANSQ
jgi:gliding motility-associated-like protein